MNIIFTHKKIELSEKFKLRVDKKLAKLDRFFDDAAQANITIKEQKKIITVELSIFSKGFVFRAESSAANEYDALDGAIEGAVRQILKNKTRLIAKNRNLRFEYIDSDVPIPEEKDYQIIRNKKIMMKPMDVEEAILQMNLLGHEFFAFTNADTNETNVIYRRNEGNYGLIELMRE